MSFIEPLFNALDSFKATINSQIEAVRAGTREKEESVHVQNERLMRAPQNSIHCEVSEMTGENLHG